MKKISLRDTRNRIPISVRKFKTKVVMGKIVKTPPTFRVTIDGSAIPDIPPNPVTHEWFRQYVQGFTKRSLANEAALKWYNYFVKRSVSDHKKRKFVINKVSLTIYDKDGEQTTHKQNWNDNESIRTTSKRKDKTDPRNMG
jgi:hypothetical protein